MKYASTLLIVIFAPQCLSQQCNVFVDDPWPTPFMFVPQNSSIQVNCRANKTSDSESFFWSIDLASDAPSDVRYQFSSAQARLNANGVYDSTQTDSRTLEESTTLTLLINDTAKNNGTVIRCTHSGEETTITSTATLFVLEPALIKINLQEDHKSINLSWSQDKLYYVVDTVQTFMLKISNSSKSHEISLNESHYSFTAPEDAQPCEIYNFSVTATYDIVGATYTGDCCSAHSRVISRMLPSLPDIQTLESSLSYFLKKEPDGELDLQVLITISTYCPTHIYTLVVSSPSNESQSFPLMLTPRLSELSARIPSDNLKDNAVFNFKVFVQNTLSLDSSETSINRIYTTDVQNITVTVNIESDHDSVSERVFVQCDFVPGSDAKGCLVQLVGKTDNTTVNVNLSRETDAFTACGIQDLINTSLHMDVFGFDIEADGTVGTIPVPGRAVRKEVMVDLDPMCMPTRAKALKSRRTQLQLVVVISSSVLCALIFTTGVVLVMCAVILYLRFKRHSGTFELPKRPLSAVNPCSAKEMDSEDALFDQSMPYYDLPGNVHPIARDVPITAASEYDRTSHSLQESPTLSNRSHDTTYSRLQDSQEHTYHVLECPDTERPQSHGTEIDSRPHSQTSSCSAPTYHTIDNHVIPIEERLYRHEEPLHTEMSSNSLQDDTGPIYQEIAGLSVTTSEKEAADIPSTNGRVRKDSTSTIVRTLV